MQTTLDETIYKFETAHRNGEVPRIVDFLPNGFEQSLLIELIHIDLEYRLKGGDAARVEQYVGEFPEVEESEEELVELVIAEWRLRSRTEALDVTSFADRFPKLRGILREQLSRSANGTGPVVVRCPDCRTPQSVGNDVELSDISCSSCGSEIRLAAESLSPGQMIAQFELVELVGTGAFGSVWKARDTELDRVVAIKVPRHKLDGPEADGFFREARATAGLRHPNIVTTYEVGRDGQHIYIASAFIEGRTLAEVLKDERFSPTEAANICLAICGALECAHAAEVVHRDLKPANIMMDPGGNPIVMDFGLAKRSVGEVTLTIDGRILGTPAFMSPEQAAGEAHSADQRSDIYSLGVILFALLTNEVPFRGGVQRVLQQVREEDPPAPRSLEPRVPRDIETICLKCLEKSPHDRFDTAAKLADELKRFIAAEPIQSRPISRVERVTRWAKRRPVPAMLYGLLTAIAIAAPIVAVNQARLRFDAEESEAKLGKAVAELKEENARTVKAEADTAKANEKLKISLANAIEQTRRAKTAVYSAQLRDARRAIDDRDFGTAMRRLGKCEFEQRGLEHGYLVGLCRRACSVRYIAAAGRLPIFIRNGEVELAINGFRSVVARDTRMRTQTGVIREFKVPELSAPFIVGIGYAPKSNRVLALDRTGLFCQWDFDTGELKKWFRIPDIQCRKRWTPHGIAVHPSGESVAVASGENHKIFEISLKDGSLLDTRDFDPEKPKPGRGLPAHCERLCYSPDGKVLIAGGYLNVRFYEKGGVYRGRKAFGGSTEGFSPVDGTFFMGWKLWKQEPDAGFAYPRVYAHLEESGPALADEQLSEAKVHTVPANGTPVSVAFSPNGKLFATGVDDGEVQIFDKETGRMLNRFTQPEKLVAIGWRADDTLVVRGSRTLVEWNIPLMLSDRKVRCEIVPRPLVNTPPETYHGTLTARHADGHAELLDGEDIIAQIPHDGTPGNLRFSGDGKYLVIGWRESPRYDAPGAVLIYSVENRKLIDRIDFAPGYYSGTHFAFIPNSASFVTSEKDHLVVMDARTATVQRQLRLDITRESGRKSDHRVAGLICSPDGRRIYARVAYEGIFCFDLANGSQLARFENDRVVDGLDIAPDGRVAIGRSTPSGEMIEIRNPALDKVLATLTGFRKKPRGILFSKDGRRLFACAEDATVRVFDSASGIEIYSEQVREFRPGRLSAIHSLRFGRDDRTLLVDGISEDFKSVTFRLSAPRK